MKTHLIIAIGLLAAASVLAMQPAAQAQGVIEGSQHGAAVGNRDAGPVGAVVGGVVGGVLGGVEGAMGVPPHRYRHAYDYHGRRSHR